MRRTATCLALLLLVGLVVGGSPDRADAIATPRLVPFPFDTGAVGEPAPLEVVLEGGQEPTGTITFEVFGPNTGCAGTPLGTASFPVHGDGEYEFPFPGGPAEPSIVIDAVGVYPMQISYSGDANNAPVSMPCGEATLRIVATPTLVLTTQEPPVVGRPVQLIANLVGGAEPSGTIDFTVFPPTDPDCQEESLLTTPAAGEVIGGRAPAPQEFVPSQAGDYQVVLAYEGDLLNGNALIQCGQTGSTLDVARVQPTVALTPSPATVVGAAIDATAAIAGGYRPTGSLTFNLYPPADATCTGLPALSVSEALAGAQASSGALATSAVGQYRFTAHYSGDTNNLPAESACGAGSVTTGKSQPTLISSSHPEAGGGGLDFGATASLAGGFEPSGTVTFTLFGPGAASCSGPRAFRVIAPVIQGAANTGTISTGGPGSFALFATYSGDARNETTTGICQPLDVSAAAAASDVMRLHLRTHASHLRLRVACPPQAGRRCRGVVRLVVIERLRGDRVVGLAAQSTRVRMRRVEVGHARYDVPAGHTRLLSIAVTASGQALARRFAGMPLRAVLQQHSPSGAGARIER
jgi:hypothetical protein